SLKARVSYVRRLVAGERLSYGLRYELDVPSTVVTVPVGYADGVPRRLGEVGGEVLIGGVRRPIAGTVTMDQLLVDLGPGDSAGGLAAADGVVRFLAERGQGFPTPGGPVPIVVAAALFDLPVAQAPGPDEGWAAAVDAARGEPAVPGRLGAGRGATVGKWR